MRLLLAFVLVCVMTTYSPGMSAEGRQPEADYETRELKGEIHELKREVEILRTEMNALKNIPNFKAAIIEHCEAEAILHMKAYASAQNAYFRLFSRYASDYSNLQAERNGGNPLGLISKRFTVARISMDSLGTAISLAGYFFLDDPNINDWGSAFGLFAIPAELEGGRVFWVGSNGDIYWQSLDDLIKSKSASPKDFVSPHKTKDRWKILN